jgi:hypothetical protein
MILACGAVLADEPNSIERGDITLHFNAVPTVTLDPQIARQYAVTRSSGRALLNIAVRRRRPDGQSEAVSASVQAVATHPNGQRQSLAVREVREGDAIYYLAEPRISDGDTLEFQLDVIVQGESEPITARFRQQFFSQR